MPPFRPGLVPRERLVRRLLHAASVPLVLAVAPAGYGKTTALIEWSERDHREFAWIAVGDAADDAAGLLTAIALGLDEIEPVGRDLFAALAEPNPGVSDVILPRLGAALTRRQRPFVLVLDDAHLVGAGESLDILKTIVEHVPLGSQLVLASRSEPRLPIGRMRAHRLIVELCWQDFVMTRGEAATLLRMTGLELDADDVATLVERTEGWPAALYLAALSLQDQPDLDRALARFAGDDRIVADYLRDELLSQVSDDRLVFLTRTSMLQTLSGPLCDVVLDRPGSAGVLRDLARSNLLLVPLDRADERYRYHGLFAEMLQAELRRLEPDNEAELHARASAWHAERGEIDRAIHHAVAAGDVARAGTLLWAIAAEYVFQGREATIRRWLDQFTPDEIALHPPLALTAATSRLAAGRGDWVEHWASAAARRLGGAPTVDGAARAETEVTVLRAAVARDGIVRMGDDAARAYDRKSTEGPWRAVCCLLMGVADHLGGNRERAKERLEEGARRGVIAAPTIGALCFAQRALLELERGDPDEGAGLAARARRQVEQASLADQPISALVLAASALARANVGRVDDAQRDVRDAMRLLARLQDFAPWYEVEVRITLARAALRLGDVVGARTLLAEASRLAPRTADAVVLHDWLQDAWGQADQFLAASVVGPTSLTTAELRVLCLLPTHLSFREIAGRLHVSANTIKTQAHAVYRKLDASSRSDAVTHAREVGLLDA